MLRKHSRYFDFAIILVMRLVIPPSKLTKLMLLTFYISALLVQVLVLIKVIPFNWVNGGMSATYAAQAVQSLVSILVIFGLYLFIRKIYQKPANATRRRRNILYIITLFWTLGLLMQLVGTAFEKYFLSLFLLIGVTSHIMLARLIRRHKTS